MSLANLSDSREAPPPRIEGLSEDRLSLLEQRIGGTGSRDGLGNAPGTPGAPSGNLVSTSGGEVSRAVANRIAWCTAPPGLRAKPHSAPIADRASRALNGPQRYGPLGLCHSRDFFTCFLCVTLTSCVFVSSVPQGSRGSDMDDAVRCCCGALTGCAWALTRQRGMLSSCHLQSRETTPMAGKGAPAGSAVSRKRRRKQTAPVRSSPDVRRSCLPCYR